LGYLISDYSTNKISYNAAYGALRMCPSWSEFLLHLARLSKDIYMHEKHMDLAISWKKWDLPPKNEKSISASHDP
jgi:hypothetical protein